MEPQVSEQISIATLQQQGNASTEAFSLRGAFERESAKIVAKTKRLLLFAACMGVPAILAYGLIPVFLRLSASDSATGGLFSEIGCGVYILSGLSLYLILIKAPQRTLKIRAAGLYTAAMLAGALLIVNMAVGWQMFLFLALLLLLVAVCFIYYWRISPGGALFLMPGIVWIAAFACSLLLL